MLQRPPRSKCAFVRRFMAASAITALESIAMPLVDAQLAHAGCFEGRALVRKDDPKHAHNSASARL